MSLLEVRDLTIRLGGRAVVEALSFDVGHGESLGVVGESGSGKTQTALALLGLSPRAAEVAGSIRFDGDELLGASAERLDRVRARRIAMVFQDPALALNPYLRIGSQLRRIVEAHRLAAGAEARRRVVEMLAAVGLPDPERQSRAYPHQLSGGMRQRAMIASALIAGPDLLVADEPTTALDVTVQAQILDLLQRIRQDTALLLITHDLGIVAGHCERTLVLRQGRLVEDGPTGRVFASPADGHTRTLIAAAPSLDADPGLAPPGDAVVLDASEMSVAYRRAGESVLNAVKSVDLELKRGETVAIVGESGSGKSSLARAILGLEAASGRIRLAGETLPADLRDRSRATCRALQLVFQDPVGSLNPQMRVAAIVAEPLGVHAPEMPGPDRRRQVEDVLGRVGLDAGFLGRYPHQLSGGQAQRVAIARALIVSPDVLVLDEAVAALDGSVRRQILALLSEVQQQSGLSMLFISHDLGVVRAISHRVAVMYLGRIVEAGPTAALYARPRHPYTRALLDAVPVADPAHAARGPSLEGEVPSVLAPPPGCPFHPRCRHRIDVCERERPALCRYGDVQAACHRAAELDLARRPDTGPG